jgi:hypothetical protein
MWIVLKNVMTEQAALAAVCSSTGRRRSFCSRPLKPLDQASSYDVIQVLNTSWRTCLWHIDPLMHASPPRPLHSSLKPNRKELQTPTLRREFFSISKFHGISVELKPQSKSNRSTDFENSTVKQLQIGEQMSTTIHSEIAMTGSPTILRRPLLRADGLLVSGVPCGTA